MKFAAAGDAIIQRRIQEDFCGYEQISPFIKNADASFFNLETTLNREGECFASQFSGGTYIRTVPETLGDIQKFGFNMTSFNNNHVLDFSYDGLLSTLECVEESGLVHSGVGRNLDIASEPAYLETNAGRVALISVNTSFNPAMMAGVQSRRIPGRPGINGMRVEKYLEVTKEELDFVRDLASRTKINAEKEITIKEGYYAPVPDGEAVLGELRFKLGEESKYKLEINPKDIERVARAIYEAKFQADYIMISVHTHEITGDSKENVPEFIEEFAHTCIDLGANAIIGHGPHLLRPVEIYKNSPIFYSLGDFILQLYNVPVAPADFYLKHNAEVDIPVRDLLGKRSKNFTVGLMEDERMFMSVIPMWETDGVKLTKLEFLPICGIMNGNKSEIGLPVIDKAEKICKYLAEMSKPYGTVLTLGDDGIIRAEI